MDRQKEMMEKFEIYSQSNLPFGKYKDQPIIETFVKDPNYFNWLSKEPWIKKYEKVNGFIQCLYYSGYDGITVNL